MELIGLKDTTLNKVERCYDLTNEIIRDLSDEGLKQLYNSADSAGLDQLIEIMFKESYQVLYGEQHIIKDVTFDYLEKLSSSVEETMRCYDMAYFVTSVLREEMKLQWFHLQWCRIVQKYQFFGIEAARGHGKCFDPETKVRMFNGRLKKVKHLKVGDRLMGVDSKPRKVLEIHSGKDEMYWVHQYRAKSYKVNSQHILCLTKSKEKHNISVSDFLDKSSYQRSQYYGYRNGFELRNKQYLLEPYFMGLWLGDGTRGTGNITNIDPEVIEYLKEYAKRKKCMFSSIGKTHKLVTRLGSGGNGDNPVIKALKKYGILKEKKIPVKYFYGSRKQRLELLAGLIDSDGNYHDGCYYVGSIYKNLATQIQQVCWSLGLRCSLSMKTEQIQWLKREDKTYVSYELCITGDLHDIPVKIERKKAIKRINQHKNFQNSRINIEKAGIGNYVGFEVDGDHKFLLEDGTVAHNSFWGSMAFPAWQLYRYKKGKYQSNSIRLARFGYLFSFSLNQAKDLLTILKEVIEGNEVLRERLFSSHKNNWNQLEITCKNKSMLRARGFGNSVRGAHPTWIMIDDPMKDNVIYSSEQRKKNIRYLNTVVIPMLMPGGKLGVIGTPFHSLDIFGDIKSKKIWRVFEYPAIFPDGTLLYPEVFSFKTLNEIREASGSLEFGREYLLQPITNETSIFPMEILNRALLRMDNYVLVSNRENFPIKFQMVVVGCDFALSASAGADYSVFTVFGVDEDQVRWLIGFFRFKGFLYAQQMAVLKQINSDFSPDVFVMEKNQFQMIFVQESDKQGLPVIPHQTGAEKNDMKMGLPGQALLFERGKYRIPTGDQRSKDVSDTIVLEFNSIGFTDKGISGVGEHDDIPMSFWLADNGVKLLLGERGGGFKFLGSM